MSDTPVGLDFATVASAASAAGPRPDAVRDARPAVEAEVVQPIDVAYRRLYPSLVRLAILLVDTTERAEEIVQDAFARAYPK